MDESAPTKVMKSEPLGEGTLLEKKSCVNEQNVERETRPVGALFQAQPLV